jgi:hypothetical protein
MKTKTFAPVFLVGDIIGSGLPHKMGCFNDKRTANRALYWARKTRYYTNLRFEEV